MSEDKEPLNTTAVDGLDSKQMITIFKTGVTVEEDGCEVAFKAA